MREDNIDEIVDSSTTDVNEDSSTSDSQDGDATPKQATEKEPPFNEHPRWKELQEDRRELREQNERLQAQLLQIVENTKPTEPQIKEKLYDAETPEEREFWAKIEKIADAKAKERESELIKKFEAERTALYNQYGKLAAESFLKSHPDIKRGSQELKEIVRTAHTKNLDLDEAYRLVMWEDAQTRAVEEFKKKQQQKNKDKLAANLETNTIPKGSPADKNVEDFDSAFLNAVKESGIEF